MNVISQLCLLVQTTQSFGGRLTKVESCMVDIKHITKFIDNDDEMIEDTPPSSLGNNLPPPPPQTFGNNPPPSP